MKNLAIRSEQGLSPTVIDVLKEAKQRALGEDPVNITVLDIDEDAPAGMPVLVMGKGDGDVRTISAAQAVTKESAVSDLTAALKNVMSVEDHKPFDYTVIERVAELGDSGNTVIVDIETSGDIRTDLPGEVRILCVAINDGEHIWVVPENLATTGPMARYLEGRTLIAHNSSFDMRYLNAALGTNLYAEHDTMLMSYTTAQGAKAHGLEALATKWLNAEPWEHHVKKFTKGGAHYELIPTDLLHQYAAEDVHWTGGLWRHFRERLEADPPRRGLYHWLMRVSRMLQDVTTGGIGVDVPLLEGMGASLDSVVAERLTTLREMTEDEDFNPGSWQQVKQFLADIAHPVTSTAEDVLVETQRILDPHDDAYKFISTLLDYRGLAKLRSTYVTGILKRQRDGVGYPEYLLHGTTTGRLSSRNFNIQNTPRPTEDDPHPIRKALVTRDEGYVTGSTDYSQIELRVLAELCGDEGMIAAFQPGSADYFDLMMPQAFPDKFADLDEFIVYKAEHPDDASNLRAVVKGVQYGLNYGRGVHAIAKQLEMAVEEADTIVSGIFATFPKMKVWQDNVARAVTDMTMDYMLTTPFNRRFQYEVITRRNRDNVVRSALSFVPQATASDICLSAALAIHERIGYYGGRITGLVHDAIYYDGPPDRMEAMQHMIEVEMKGAASAVFHRVQFDVESGIGSNWMEVG